MLVLALVLIAPVAGPVERGFDPGLPFEAGRHRGIDLAAPAGAAVRAACTGPVAFAGRIGATGIVTVRCGPWRVTHMPLAAITVRGGTVSRGAPIGRVAASSDHVGLHLGVRRDGTRFGYVDPLRFLARPASPPPLGRGPRSPRAGPRGVPRPVRPPSALPRPVRPPGVSSPLAPWPAWAGLALALAGAGVRLRGRSRRRKPYSNPELTAAGR